MRKSTFSRAAITTPWEGNRDQGYAIANTRPASVPGTVIESGITFSSRSTSDAASISASRTTWLTKRACATSGKLSVKKFVPRAAATWKTNSGACWISQT